MTKPAGYEPDLFSEHARLAQLGARVVEILRATYSPVYLAQRTAGADEILEAALSLGLIGEEVLP